VALVKICAKAGNQLLDVTVERQNGQYLVHVDGVPRRVDAHKLEGDFYSIIIGHRSFEVSVEADRSGYRVRHGGSELLVTITDPGRAAREAVAGGAGPAQIVTMMPGRVVRILVAKGDQVEEGQGLIVVEAMKMENEIAAPKAGTVQSIEVSPGQTVEGGALLAVVD
jgi:biotin carboxyl carrier protein